MKKRKIKIYFLIGLGCFIVLVVCMIGFNQAMEKTSTDESCMACHVHPDAENSWKQSVHYNNKSGAKVGCASCHLPPQGTLSHFTVKARMGMAHMWAYMTKNKDKINWEKMGELEHAQKTVFNKSCEACHVNLYPDSISDEGTTAHLYYEDNKVKQNLQCISCHLDAGHFIANYKHEKMVGKAKVNSDVHYAKATPVTQFKNFKETVPGTAAAIDMVAIPGGTFEMGSTEDEAFHQDDEAPVHKVKVSPFFMGEYEITWDQYWAFYNETMSEGRTPPRVVYANNTRPNIDAVTGPTPPFGFPDQGWGMGNRPAITMTHYAAETFCQWLSLKTGKKYRLPTEAEWEYAARGGKTTPYFFDGNPKSFSTKGFWNKIFGADTAVITRYVIYAGNSDDKSQEPDKVKANPYGLKNMLGNVMEYCSDWYAKDAYSKVKGGAVNPKGPASGKEHVVRGGSFADDASMTRCASRAHTEHDAWLKTDPQNPKSIWWYSDIKGIGFRVVCEVPSGVKTKTRK